MSSTNNFVHTAFAARFPAPSAPTDTNIYPPQKFQAKVHAYARGIVIDIWNLVATFFKVLAKVTWNILKEIPLKTKLIVAAAVMFNATALYNDLSFFGTPHGWGVGAVSLTCVVITITGAYKYVAYRESCEARKPVVENVAHLKKATKIVNELEKEEKAERRRQEATSPPWGYVSFTEPEEELSLPESVANRYVGNLWEDESKSPASPTFPRFS
ncbi:hypothetical protein BU23DRAFT_594788 [Bimuria novae-zelandiae CBS 107.79]|uniref:Uncharacterized protein n=1 Tax=Bimuria novae-zelandiae CBS 107.79 TaxID=1447943 RepID=A0A6A5VSI2_9PLEO|nr:hypothetical protein BU23DRAFT_594788 [Bimuria novae-zelandiae CBS 107.79]